MSQPPVHAPNAALLIDFDNVTLGIQKDLTKELRTLLNSDIIKGKVAVQRAYADWRRYPQYIVSLSESSIDLIFAPAFGSSKKNATDIRLAVDAIELVFTRPEIGTFILLSGDSDFSTMVIKLKEYGKYVIGVGIRESASDLLIQNCDEYYSYSDLAGLTKEADVPSTQRDPWALAAEAVTQMARTGDVMRSDRLKQVMQQIDPNFDERNAGFSRFSKFVLEAAQKGMLLVTKLENGQYEVAPAVAPPVAAPPAAAPLGTTPAAARDSAEPARDGREDGGRRGRPRRGRGRDRERGPRERERGEGARDAGQAAEQPVAERARGALTLARAFQLMAQALGELRPPVGQEALRLRMVAMHGREDALLDAARFAKLLHQANDAEVADVRRLDDGEYEISPHRLGAVGLPPVPALPAAAATPPAAVTPAPAAPPIEAAAELVESAPAAAAPGSAADTGGRGDGMRMGVRFRRGSRAPLRAGEIPLIGVVRVHEPPLAEPAPEATAAPAEPAPVSEPSADMAAAPAGPAPGDGAPEGGGEGAGGEGAAPPARGRKTARPRRTPRKKAAPAGAAASATTGGGGENVEGQVPEQPVVEEPARAARPKRSRPRARKKTE